MNHQTLLTVAALNMIVDASPSEHVALLYELAKECPQQVIHAMSDIESRGNRSEDQ